MRASLFQFGALAGAIVLLVVNAGACGGKVVIDSSGGPGGEGGAGGSLPSGPGSSTVTTTGPGGCGFPAPSGNLFGCSSGATSGSGMPVQCAEASCDESGNIYEAFCIDDSCECTYFSVDGEGLGGCSCTLSSVCTLGGPTCCPYL